MTSIKGTQSGDARMRRIDRFLVDLRRGMPAVIENPGGSAVLVLASELVSPASLSDYNALDGLGAAHVLLTHARAETLKIRLYTPGAIAIELGPDRPLEVIEHLADPAKDLDHAMMGPFQASRDPLGEAAFAAIKSAKLAGLLPSTLIRSIDLGKNTSASAWASARGFLCLEAKALLQADELFAQALGPNTGALTDLVQITSASVPLQDGPETRLVAFRPTGLFGGGPEHIAIVVGNPKPDAPVLVRLHSECFTGDLLASLKCDCGDQLRGAIGQMHTSGSGIVLYLAQEGRGIGLMNKLRAYHYKILALTRSMPICVLGLKPMSAFSNAPL